MMTLSRFRNLQYFILVMTVVCVVVLYLHFSQQAMATTSTTPPTSPHYQDEDTHYPCGICDHSVGWDQCGVACESCGQWFHAGCQNISSKSYEHLGRSDVTWHCVICANANHSSIAFDLHGLSLTQHNTTSDSSQNTNLDSPFHPYHTSTPSRASK